MLSCEEFPYMKNSKINIDFIRKVIYIYMYIWRWCDFIDDNFNAFGICAGGNLHGTGSLNFMIISLFFPDNLSI
jgi:hypothetical protein